MKTLLKKITKKPQGSFFPFLSEWKGIVLSFIIAIMFWFFHSLEKEYSTSIQYPLAISNTDERKLQVVAPPPSDISIEVKGGGWQLLKASFGLGIDSIKIVLEDPLDHTFLPTSFFQNHMQQQLKESHLQLINVIEDTIYFEYNKIIEKEVMLYLERKNINLAPEYKITSKIKIPKPIIKFKGAYRYISMLPDTLEILLEESDINENFHETVSIPYPYENHIAPNLSEVEVSFTVAKFVEKKSSIHIAYKNFPKEKEIKNIPQKIIATYKINESYIDKLEEDSLKIVLDYNQYNPKDSSIIPQINFPHYINNVEIERIKIWTD